MSTFSYSQEKITQLPYNKNLKYPNKITAGIVMAKMVDELGYKYYWATDSLFNDESKYTFNSNNLARILLKGVYQMSENIINYTLENNIKPEPKLEEMSYEDFRKITLLNLKEASSILIKNAETTLLLNWAPFMNYIAYSNAYCDQIILFRENNGNPFKPKNDLIGQKSYKSKMFEQSLGADGLTNRQWMKIMERGGGGAGQFGEAHDKIRRTNRINQKIFVELKKEERRATVTVGNLERIELSSNVVDGITYTYFKFPPKQLSFLFSNDKELMEGIINWIIYINSGNPVKLSEMFRVGPKVFIPLETNEYQSIVHDRYRDILDKEENKVRLEFSEKYFDRTKFSDIIIKEVRINNNTQIEFFGKSIRKDNLSQNPKLTVFLLKNIEGDLLDRIKLNINKMREGLNDYDDRIMNLRKY